ncbi:Translation elongation/initiation factor/Ribosomal beta-barrel [Penicillium riverlandense]|uniref:Translation elongation/initiation factor/Ribosomal beta-barrel n=1 Tax=Penicillium riverlandense TaxID=1903569 RepID=UPI002547CDE6|nr:Translation elongation/initiation factor/Ribosomal beta-barrel [Penicillium riverlandense]KAJ5808429.1 Translation elongation/initiation factor/Ribosomal beta-barrel [Penicillium riverlandense]
MKTEAVYLHDSTLRTLNTEIESCQAISSLSENEQALAKNVAPEHSALTTHKTIFYPQGGGQPSDIGIIRPVDSESSRFKVSLVRKTREGKILHFGELIDDAHSSSPFSAGAAVVQKIDSPTRNYHTRLHSAGHIVGVAMQLLFPDMKKVKANHAPREAAMEYEGLLYNEHKPLIQQKVDELVRQDLPILISWSESTDLQTDDTQDARDGPIRVASIGGLDHNPCGGTHVASTSLVGAITIRKISRQKGVSRVAYEVPLEERE